jgi:hypothetical protein
MKKFNTTPENWPSNAPAYHSSEGWTLEKEQAYKKLKAEVQAKRGFTNLQRVKNAFVNVIALGEGTDQEKTIVYFCILVPVLFLIGVAYLIKLKLS